MRIACFSNEIPFPPIHGGRVDVWRRLCAFAAAGVRLHLVTWCSDRPGEVPEPEHLAAVRKIVERLYLFPIRRTPAERIRRLGRLARWPSHAASRVLSRRQQESVTEGLRNFSPDAVWLDAIYGAAPALTAASALGVPLFYRAHNIEHIYMARQVERARSMRDRLAWGLNLFHLEEIETEVVRRCARRFEISVDDLAWWNAKGYSRGEWLPPLVEPGFAERLSAPRRNPATFDVAYMGNLFAPNNVEGIVWFLDRVLLRLASARPNLRVCIAGSRPDRSVRRAAEHAPGVTLLDSPPDAAEVLRDAKVLINPVFSGSGVNVKSVEMLFSSAALVSTPQGLAGLPADLRACFLAAEGEDGFAEAVLQGLSEPAEMRPGAARLAARETFSFSKIEQVLKRMRSDCGGERQ